MNPWTRRPYSSRYHELLEKRRALPVWWQKGEFLRLLGLNKVVIVVGPSAGGKTTQVPQFVLQAWSGKVACTQPWRVVAMTASQRVADEMDVTLGEQVGYTVPLEECRNHNTVIMYLTDSMLLKEAAADPMFEKYKVIIVDEAHERFSNRRFHNPDTGVEALFVSEISQRSASRKALIAGTTQEGMCFRLYTEDMYQEDLSGETYPESLTLNLSSIVLGMKKLGIDDLVNFKYMDSVAPAPVSIERALSDLSHLRAVDPEYGLEPLGEVMNAFPLDTQMSAMIIASPKYHCSNEIVSLSAMLLVPNCFIRRVHPDQVVELAMWQEAESIWEDKFVHVDGDHLTLLNVYNSYAQNNRDSEWCKMNFINAQVMNYAYHVRQKLVRIMTGLNIPLCSPASDSFWFYNNVKLAMLTGYFMQVAHRETVGYSVMLKDDNQVLDVDFSTFLNRRAEWIIYHETNSNIARIITDVQAAMLLMIARA